MANYDDIFNASAQDGTEDKSFVSFNKEEWAAQKKQERESAFAMIDETAQRMANDGGLFQSYLDVQARFDRYSVGNAVLITAQKADATQLSDFKGWKNNGVFIKKGESGIVLLEPGEEYTKEDGTVGVSYNSKKVFDISQTTAKAKTFAERLEYLCTFNEVADTNVEAVFDLILDAAVRNNVPQEELPETLYLISDMEFNACVRNASVSNFASAKRRFAEHGYRLPQIVFWNVASRNSNQPVTKNEQGVALVSGCTPRLFSMVASGDLSPYSVMMDIIESERYAKISA